MNESPLEKLLRRAPRPQAPADLKQHLIMNTQSSQPSSPAPGRAVVPRNWLQRWWPVLVPAGFSVACAAALVMQRMEIQDLQQSIQTLSAGTAASPSTASTPAEPQTGTAGDAAS